MVLLILVRQNFAIMFVCRTNVNNVKISLIAIKYTKRASIRYLQLTIVMLDVVEIEAVDAVLWSLGKARKQTSKQISNLAGR